MKEISFAASKKTMSDVDSQKCYRLLIGNNQKKCLGKIGKSCGVGFIKRSVNRTFFHTYQICMGNIVVILCAGTLGLELEWHDWLGHRLRIIGN